jgi:hypothetical protein
MIKYQKHKIFFVSWGCILVFGNMLLATKFAGYSIAKDFVSLLNAINSPVRLPATLLSLGVGLSLVGYVRQFKPFRSKNTIYGAYAFGASYLLNVFIPCANSCSYRPLGLGIAHDLISLTELLAIYYLGSQVYKKRGSKLTRAFAATYIICACSSAVAGALFYRGLWQRAGELAFGLYLYVSIYQPKEKHEKVS